MSFFTFGPRGYEGRYSVYVCEGCGTELATVSTITPATCMTQFGEQLPCGGTFRLILAPAGPVLSEAPKERSDR